MKIGVTCIVKKDTNVFSNGLLQNILTMKTVYEKCPNVEACYFINTYTADPNEFKGTYWESYASDFISMDEMDICDVIVVTGGFIGKQRADDLRKKGKKVVQHVMSASLSLFTEKVIFSDKKAGVYDHIEYDAVWVSPQFYERDKFFTSVIHRCPSYEAPFVWDPKFIEADCKESNYSNGYEPSLDLSKKISIIEPNINMVKTCMVPLTIVETVQRNEPELIKQVHVFGAQKIRDNLDFIDFAGNLDINKQHKVKFVGRFGIVFILKNYTDIMLFHQNQCELNYAYFDAAWLGFPIIHNSPMIRNLGFMYHDNDAYEAANLISQTSKLINVPGFVEQYKINSQKFISKFLAINNVDGYSKLINKLFCNS